MSSKVVVFREGKDFLKGFGPLGRIFCVSTQGVVFRVGVAALVSYKGV